MRKTYVYDKVQKKVVEKAFRTDTPPGAVHIFKPFISAIDGTEIRDASQLAVHDRKHGVTDPRNYGPDWFERESKNRDNRLTGGTKADKQDRIKQINQAMKNQGL